MENILERINQAGLEFLVSLNLQQTYAKVAGEAARLVGAKMAVLHLWEDGNFVRAGSYPPSLPTIGEPRKRGFTFRSYKEKQAFIVRAATLNNVHPELKRFGYEEVVFIPISDHEGSIGTLSVMMPKEKAFSDKELKALGVFGSYASLAIRKAHLFEEIKEALETRDLFISMAAHELRTPLTTISGYVQLLRTKFAKVEATEARWVEELSWEVSRLTQLVNELLEVGRINSGKLQYVWREQGLKQIIRRGIQDFQFSYPQHKVVFLDQIGNNRDILVGDFDKLLQVVINLLDNAGKFSPPGSEITVGLKFRSPYFILTIRDWGRGIAKKDLPHVFEGFYRGKDVAREGMGLGLFLAKNIVEEHHGSVHMHSRPNKGTLVEVQLPRVRYGRVV